MKKVIVLLFFAVLFSITETLSNDHIGQGNKELILNDKVKQGNTNFFGIFIVKRMYDQVIVRTTLMIMSFFL